MMIAIVLYLLISLCIFMICKIAFEYIPFGADREAFVLGAFWPVFVFSGILTWILIKVYSIQDFIVYTLGKS